MRILALLAFIVAAPAHAWVTGYYLGVAPGSPVDPHRLLPANVDFKAVTHVIYFGAMAKPDGSLDTESHSVESNEANELIRLAHEAGRKALLCIGIESGKAASAATGSHRARLVSSIVALVNRLGFDGADLDWEPFEDSHTARYRALVTDLRHALPKAKLLTAAVIDLPGTFGALAPKFDQINLMTYDLGGLWAPKVWHHTALESRGDLGDVSDYPSVHSSVDAFVAAGVPPAKLGVGIGFYGYVWRGGTGTPTGGVTAPGQTWATKPVVNDSADYTEIARELFRPEYYQWDERAHAPYLSIDRPGSADDEFVSYDDERSCKEKTRFAREHGLGGVMIWQLGGDWLPEQTPPDPLLQAVKAASGS